MSKNLEIETKCMITEADYLKLIESYPEKETYKQVNHYISNKKMLSQIEKYGLRVRQKRKQFELTLKVTEKIGKTEISQIISKRQFKELKLLHIFPKGEVRDYLIQNKICRPNSLRIIGKLTTWRTDLKFYTALISIDKSKYNKVIDYEIESECETPAGAENDLLAFLDYNQIEYKKSEQNKLARFLSTTKH